MSDSTKQPQATSLPKITKREWQERLKAARAKERQRKKEGKPRPNPTKPWSEESWKALSEALSGRS